MQYRKFAGLWIFLLVVLTACGGSTSPTSPVTSPVDGKSAEPTSEQLRTTPEINLDQPKPTITMAEPTLLPPTPEPLFYNLPGTTLTSEVGLYASPNNPNLITPALIPAGETVYLMGRNATGSYLRVVWNTAVGWLPVSFTEYNNQRDQLDLLPVFEREPPRCATPLDTQFSFNATWKSDKTQRIAVVVDVFRARYGPFPPSTLALTLDGVVIAETRRPIVEQGQFSLKDVVLSLPGRVQDGQVLGYMFETISDEPLSFMATVFEVPDNCRWDL